MLKDNKRKPDSRMATMHRTKVRASHTKNQQKQKKRQTNLARQEQRLAEKLEQQQKKNLSAGSRKPVNSPEKTKSTSTRERVRKAQGGFQVIVGGRRKKSLQRFSVLALILAVVVIINSSVPIGVGEYVQNVLSGFGGGGGFPVAVSQGNNQLLSVGSDIALLNDSSLLLYKANGKQLFDRQHGFSDPAFTACSARVLVYNRGGVEVRMENRAKTLFTMKGKGEITCATMADNGTFALVTRGSDYISDVTVYNAKAKEQFVWHSSARQVTAVALSDNGRFLTVATLHVEGGEAVTGLTMFDVRRGTTLFEEICKGSGTVSLDCKGTTVVAVLTDRVVAVTKTGKRTEYLFDGGNLVGFDNHQSYGTVVALGMYQDVGNNRLVVLDKHLNIKGQGEVSATPSSLSAKGSYISVLTDGQISFFNRKGVLRKEVPLKTDGKQLLCKGNYAILLTSDGLEEIKK